MDEEMHAGPSKALDIVLWALQLVAAVVFCLTGAAKIAGSDAEVQLFTALGFGQWFRYFTGALEIAGALLIVFPGTAVMGAWLLALVMSGATVANLMLDTSPALPLGLLVAMVSVGIGRHKKKVHHHHLTAHPPHPVH